MSAVIRYENGEFVAGAQISWSGNIDSRSVFRWPRIVHIKNDFCHQITFVQPHCSHIELRVCAPRSHGGSRCSIQKKTRQKTSSIADLQIWTRSTSSPTKWIRQVRKVRESSRRYCKTGVNPLIQWAVDWFLGMRMSWHSPAPQET